MLDYKWNKTIGTYLIADLTVWIVTHSTNSFYTEHRVLFWPADSAWVLLVHHFSKNQKEVLQFATLMQNSTLHNSQTRQYLLIFHFTVLYYLRCFVLYGRYLNKSDPSILKCRYILHYRLVWNLRSKTALWLCKWNLSRIILYKVRLLIWC